MLNLFGLDYVSLVAYLKIAKYIIKSDYISQSAFMGKSQAQSEQFFFCSKEPQDQNNNNCKEEMIWCNTTARYVGYYRMNPTVCAGSLLAQMMN